MNRAYSQISLTLSLILLLLISIANVSSVSASPATSPPSKITGIDELEFLTHSVVEIWGEKDIWLPSSTKLVQYEEDLGERSMVDFETGEVRVQLLINIETNAMDDLVIAHMRQGIRNLILRDASDPVEGIPVLTASKKKSNPHNLSLDVKPSPVSKHPLILDQIRMADGSRVSKYDVQRFAAEVVKKKTIRVVQIKGRSGKTRQVVTARFNLAPDHLEIRARKYFPMVKTQAKQYGVEPSLIMSIIHTESMFNPRARSHAPAYGLMQLVPSTGATDAYQQLYGKKHDISSRYLYDPKNNIELGVVYFHILRNRYMKRIKDAESRTFCAIAAYNAGASNVAKAFISKKSINKAASVINKMESEEVYDRLVTNSLSVETRNYVRKVLTRSVLYNTW